jgi:hypothetical protein
VSDYIEQHYRTVTKALAEGRVVPLLGAGVNLAERPADASWHGQCGQLPSATELASYLTHEFEIDDLVRDEEDLVRVAQTVAVMKGDGWLYDKLHPIFAGDYPPTAVHRFLAALPGALRARGSAPPYQVILTTNYDDTLERAFRAVEEPYDLVWYVVDPHGLRSNLWHAPWPQDQPASWRPIERPNEYDEISLDARTVIVKFHGAVDRVNRPPRDSFVITEDDYIHYPTPSQLTSMVPVELAAKLRTSHFLFLGYGLRDWNVRLILHRIWSARRHSYPSWAIQRKVDPVDSRLWQKRGDVDILDLELRSYVQELATRLNVPL